MLKRMDVKNLTVFPQAELHFGRQLNIIVGENGAGKTHLLKMAYTLLAVSAEEGKKPSSSSPTKTSLQYRIAEKLVNVFRPEQLGRLARRKQGRERCEVKMFYEDKNWNVSFDFATNSKSEVNIDVLPSKWVTDAPAYLPTRELLTIFPNFISVYEGHYLDFEETWRDTCILLGAPLQRGPKEENIKRLLRPLETAMDGSIELDRNGRFYLRTKDGRLEMPLVAEGFRKLGMLSRLIATGALLDRGFLFWDEPEANLNPKLVRWVAKSIVDLSSSGIQIFIATHSLFLLRELEILLEGNRKSLQETRFFGLHRGKAGVCVKQGASIDDIGDITALDEELEQTDRFLEEES
ncbi:AAA family ATPase [Hahella aquimaris]|uniref:AAA family ATPase n=1 Tax=Hahella sp. HNIBRBA332 TaxID=3015983 RepID=UPI00273B567A|nr:AAA family ATPase [Hahella sp. HNIBRBA332]WLQ11331.1 AAA family ATPase [Hahella sp. HNIBRBA332]